MPNTKPPTIVELSLTSSDHSVDTESREVPPYFELTKSEQANEIPVIKSKGSMPYFQTPDEEQPEKSAELQVDDIELFVEENKEYTPQTKQKIGSGNYSVVYKIQHATTKQWVAIKEFDIEETVKNDANILEALSGKKQQDKLEGNYVVDFIGRIYLQGQLHLVMEYMPQGSLESFIFNFKHIPKTDWTAYWQIANPIVVKCLKGLQFIHSVGFAHRDIKPANILLTTHFEPKFCDFGLATELGREAYAVGTPLYSAPEIVELYRFRSVNKGAKTTLKVTPYGDYFAMAIAIWELAARSEVDEDNLEELYENRVVKGKRYGIDSTCPVKVSQIIQSLWHHEPNKRQIPDGFDEEEKNQLSKSQ